MFLFNLQRLLRLRVYGHFEFVIGCFKPCVCVCVCLLGLMCVIF